jgi:protein O-GlcNAc transferase
MSSVADLLAAAERCQQAGNLVEAEALCRQALEMDPGHAAILRRLGAIEFQGGRYDAAERTVRRLLAATPADPALCVSLGTVLHRQGRAADALAAFQAALAVDAFNVAALIGSADAARIAGRFDDAVGAGRKAVAIAPSNAEACNILGAALQANGDTREALEWFEKAVAMAPDDARIQYNRGVALEELKRTDAALAAYRRAVTLDPRLAAARNNLGHLLTETGDDAPAIEHLQIAAGLEPDAVPIHNNLGKALYNIGRYDDARASFDRAVQIDPASADAVANIGAIERTLGQLDAALATLKRATELNPRLADAHANLGIVLRDLGRFNEAEAHLRRAIELRSDEPEFHVALALLLNDQGCHIEALACIRAALALRPDSVTVHRRRLGILLYHSETNPAVRFAECRAFGARFGRPPPTSRAPARRGGEPDRRLRIGYLSSDLRGDHPVARNLAPVFAAHDHARFEIVTYADVPAPDATTREFQRLSDAWRPILGHSDAEVADQVAADQVDILVVVAGRFDRNRPLVAAYRPAPIQVSFHDPATSGVDAIDYLIADAQLVPPAGTERFTERVVRLPRFYIHAPLDSAPPVGPLPMAAAGRPTFGCFNNPAKLSTECLAAWARVLSAVPAARLMLRFRNWYASTRLRERVTGVLAAHGVGAERLTLLEADTPGVPHLAVYNQVDVALDPFPFTGSTTTFESLWMGVPVVTLAGDTMVSRWSASMLGAVGLGALAAPTIAGYVDAAAALVADPGRLSVLRAGLRDELAASSLCDGRSRTRQLERLYRAMWRRYLAAKR